jgi:pyruvate dehydrogenase E1 component
LGTDGFGRSDTREQLRGFFEVDERFVTLAALTELASAQVIAERDVEDAIEEMGIAPDKPNPRRS